MCLAIIPIRNSKGERTIAQQTMNIRRQRILEAIENGAIPNHITEVVPDNYLKLDRFVPLQNKLRSVYDAEQANEMKLKVLENWEATKRKAIERLSEEIEWLQALEEKIEKREDKLSESGKKINEAAFQKMCTEIFAHPRPTKASPTTKPIKPTLTVRTNTIKSTKKLPIAPPPAKPFGDDSDMVEIGPNGTTVSAEALNRINWSLPGAAVTRKILMEVFDRETLAFHTLTGKPSPAFMDCDKPQKHKLDPAKVEDIIHIVTKRLGMSPKEVRSAITTKCADENKMYRQREKKRLSMEAPKAKKMKFDSDD